MLVASGLCGELAASDGSCIIEPGSAVHVGRSESSSGVSLTTFAARPKASAPGSVEMRHRTVAISSGSSFDSHKGGLAIVVR